MKKFRLQFDFKTRHAGTSTLITLAVLAAVILVNTLAAEWDLQLDLTPKKLYSLTENTEELLATLKDEVEILALYGVNRAPEEIMEALNEYSRASSLITVETVDPDRNPGLLARFSDENKPVAQGSFVVASGRNYRVITEVDMYEVSYGQNGPQVLGQKVEQQVTSAIAYVTSGRTPRIYEITGHQETTLAAMQYGSMLQQANYVLEDLSLVLSDIPADAALLTVVGPRTDFSEAETEKLNTYLSGGGGILFALDLHEDRLPNLKALLAKWDIEVISGLILEDRTNRLISGFGDNPLFFAPYMQEHEILTPLNESRQNPAFGYAMGLRRTNSRQRRLEYFPLLTTSEDSRLRVDLESEEARSSFNAIPSDIPGPIDVAVAVQQRSLDTYEREGASIVVMSSAGTLAGLGYMGQIRANAEFLSNMINWAVGQDSSIVSVPSKSLFRLPLGFDTFSAVIYAVAAIIVIPAIMVAAALIVFLRRRHR